MAVKLDIVGSNLTYGYETELADRALRKALVTGATSKEAAIKEAVNAAAVGGENLYTPNNIPLQSATAIRLGADRWLVDLAYARTRISQRRDALERRVSVTTLPDVYVPVYSTSPNRTNGLPFDVITSNTYQYWYGVQYVPGTAQGQDPMAVPKPYMFRKPQIRIQVNYTVPVYNFGDGYIEKLGKTNSNQFYIAEIAGSYQPGELLLEGFSTDPREISRWSAGVTFRHVPGGFYTQRVLWNNGATYPNQKYWYLENVSTYEQTQF